MRGSVANLLRVAVMIALVTLGVSVLYGREDAPVPEPEPPAPRWNDLSAVVNAWEMAPVIAPAPPVGCGLKLSVAATCEADAAAGALTGAAGTCALAAGRFVFDLTPGTIGTVRCVVGGCKSRPIEVKAGGVAAKGVAGEFSGCAVAWPTSEADMPAR